MYLANLVTQLLPGDDEALGLQALLFLQHARRDARVDAAGELLTLEEQDRDRWNRVRIGEGLEYLAAARATGRPPGAYRLQAEIAALHTTAADPGEHRSNWPCSVDNSCAQGGRSPQGGRFGSCFPEGTRTPNGEIQEFKTALFILPIRSRIPVVPVLIEGTFQALKRGSILVNPVPLKLTFYDPIPADSFEVRDRKIYAEKVREVLAISMLRL